MIFDSESRIKNQKSESMIKIWFESNFESRIKKQKSESMFSSSILIQIFYFFLVWQKKLWNRFFNKRSPTQVVRFWGRSVLKLNPERAVEIPEQIILVQNFTADLMAQRPDFYLPPFGRYSW